MFSGETLIQDAGPIRLRQDLSTCGPSTDTTDDLPGGVSGRVRYLRRVRDTRGPIVGRTSVLDSEKGKNEGPFLHPLERRGLRLLTVLPSVFTVVPTSLYLVVLSRTIKPSSKSQSRLSR